MEYEVEIVRRLRVRVNSLKGPSEALQIATDDYNLAEYEVTNIQIIRISPFKLPERGTIDGLNKRSEEGDDPFEGDVP